MVNNLLIIVGIRWISFSLETPKPFFLLIFFSKVDAKILEQIHMWKKQGNAIKK